MLNITDIIEIDGNNKERLRIQREIEERSREIEALNTQLHQLSNKSDDNNKESKDKTPSTDVKAHNKDNLSSIKSEDAHKHNGYTLTTEEEAIVSAAIKQDPEKDEQVRKEIEQIIKKSNAEYDAIKADKEALAKSRRSLVISGVLMIILVILTFTLTKTHINNKTSDIDNISIDNEDTNTSPKLPVQSNVNSNISNGDENTGSSVDYTVQLGDT